MKNDTKNQKQDASKAKPKAEKLKKITLKDLENVTGGRDGGANPDEDPNGGVVGIN